MIKIDFSAYKCHFVQTPAVPDHNKDISALNVQVCVCVCNSLVSSLNPQGLTFPDLADTAAFFFFLNEGWHTDWDKTLHRCIILRPKHINHVRIRNLIWDQCAWTASDIGTIKMSFNTLLSNDPCVLKRSVSNKLRFLRVGVLCYWSGLYRPVAQRHTYSTYITSLNEDNHEHIYRQLSYLQRLRVP